LQGVLQLRRQKTNTKEKGKGVKAVARFFVLAGLPHILKGGKA
jgi:hypothetical protein